MKWTALALLALAGAQDRICDHGIRGAARRIDLDVVTRVHRDAKRAYSLGAPPVPGRASSTVPLPLPACRSRGTRRMNLDRVPAALPELRFAKDGLGLPDQATADFLGIRCTPTRLRRLTDTEVELVEGD